MAQNHQSVRAPSHRPPDFARRLQARRLHRQAVPEFLSRGNDAGLLYGAKSASRTSKSVALEKRLRQSEIPTDAATHPTTTIEAVPCNTLTVSKVEVNYRSVAQTAGFLGAVINPPPIVTRP
jgi:hypothetical protein